MTSRLLAAMALVVCQTSAFALQEFTVTRGELAMMPPYCTAIDGKYVGLPQFENSPLRDTVPASCHFVLNHFCDGLKAMIRVHTTPDPNESDFWLEKAVGAINSVIAEWDQKNPDCPLRADAYLNLGKAQLLKTRRHQGSAPQAALNFSRALELKPTYLDAYYALSDLYVEEGNKQKALSVVEDGLRHVPEAKGLLRRFRALGGKTPPTPIVVAPKSDVTDETSKATIEQQHLPNQPAENKQEPVTSEPTKIGSPKNPYCRFCPPE
jgi:tetratricopeptide (TPR) repeat protein